MIDFSIEFFPPSSPAMEDKLWRTYETLKKYNPSLISVTYGADGSTRDRTHDIVKKLIKEKNTCCSAFNLCRIYQTRNIKNPKRLCKARNSICGCPQR